MDEISRSSAAAAVEMAPVIVNQLHRARYLTRTPRKTMGKEEKKRKMFDKLKSKFKRDPTDAEVENALNEKKEKKMAGVANGPGPPHSLAEPVTSLPSRGRPIEDRGGRIELVSGPRSVRGPATLDLWVENLGTSAADCVSNATSRFWV